MSRTVLVFLFAAIAFIGMSEAAASCGPNEELTLCLSPCVWKCGEEPIDCIEECMGAGCQCKPGFVKNSHGKCVPPEQC